MNKEPDIQQLAKSAEALLFTEGGPMQRRKLAGLLGCSEPELDHALTLLKERLTGGISIMESAKEISLAVAPSTSETVRAALKRELSHDIGEAGLEVLSIILYCGPSTRARIDYIRGVNSASTLRTLLSRGLLEREGNPEDAREYLYRPTIELLAHLGLRDAKELPDYEAITAELAHFESAATEHGTRDSA